MQIRGGGNDVEIPKEEREEKNEPKKIIYKVREEKHNLDE